ncbi:MAG: MATE family efflux transporter [Lachnospiraceae bacterium]|nr:MATE family efflux transporter [Lachnospiraceae bacterium]
MKRDLTKGSETTSLLLFAAPMILGNLLQQVYNIADTWVVGRFVSSDALAAVGSAYTLMTFLTSILIGLCMGSGAVFSFYYGKGEKEQMQNRLQTAFVLIGVFSILLNVVVLVLVKPVLFLMRIPEEITSLMQDYVEIVFCGIFFVFLYNFFAFLLRSLGNSIAPLFFLGAASVLNVVLDLIFVICFGWGIKGAATATVISQGLSGVGLAGYTWIFEKELRFKKRNMHMEAFAVKEIVRFSVASSLQQSVMNFGILMIQGLVNTFGASVMAAFAAAVKIDTFAYMPAQEFGNAYSIFISQNYGAGAKHRIRNGTKEAIQISVCFCVAISIFVYILARYLMMIFVKAGETEIIQIGMGYLRIEGVFYLGIGILFLLYGYYRGINRPEMSLVLTIISLGTRVVLAYTLAPITGIGVLGIWWAIPVGWLLADVTGIVYMKRFVQWE